MSSRPTLMDLSTDRVRDSRDPSLLLIRDLIYKACGIFQPDNKLNFLRDRCCRRMKVIGIDSIHEYFTILSAGAHQGTEVRKLLNQITVGETSFFRNEPQLEAIRKIVLPNVMKARKRLSFLQLRIWSCGCSTGEEPYTLAMILLEESAKLSGWDWEIIATDLNDHSLEKAKHGVYESYSLRNTARAYVQKYFVTSGPDFAIADAVKARVKFSRLNLLDDGKMALNKNLDIIICGNVLIYFDAASKRRAIRHFFNSLLPGGYFFLGHSESLYGVSEDFRLVHFPGATAYVKSSTTAAMSGAR
jgi:chemotaxis protein methyltransferase CheR